MADERHALHAYLSVDAHEAWHEFAAEEGVSVSGLLQAYGEQLIPIVQGKAQMTKDQQALIKTARKIDAARRRRRRD